MGYWQKCHGGRSRLQECQTAQEQGMWIMFFGRKDNLPLAVVEAKKRLLWMLW